MICPVYSLQYFSTEALGIIEPKLVHNIPSNILKEVFIYVDGVYFNFLLANCVPGTTYNIGWFCTILYTPN